LVEGGLGFGLEGAEAAGAEPEVELGPGGGVLWADGECAAGEGEWGDGGAEVGWDELPGVVDGLEGFAAVLGLAEDCGEVGVDREVGRGAVAELSEAFNVEGGLVGGRAHAGRIWFDRRGLGRYNTVAEKLTWWAEARRAGLVVLSGGVLGTGVKFMVRGKKNVVGAGLVSALALMALGGCAGKNSESKAEELRGNLTPELDTLSQRQTDMDNEAALTIDENGRMLNEDWRRLWLLDRPSRLTPNPVPR
jgi:hypothetical protein